MKGVWKMKALLEIPCPDCPDFIIRVYRSKKETLRSRLRQSVNQHCLTHHPGMGQRERSRFADRLVEKEGL